MMCERNRTLLNLAIRQCMYTVLNIDKCRNFTHQQNKNSSRHFNLDKAMLFSWTKTTLLSCEVFCVRDRVNI